MLAVVVADVEVDGDFNRLEALLKEAHIKVSSLVSDLLGISARRTRGPPRQVTPPTRPVAP